jgi:hypothetical protein
MARSDSGRDRYIGCIGEAAAGTPIGGWFRLARNATNSKRLKEKPLKEVVELQPCPVLWCPLFFLSACQPVLPLSIAVRAKQGNVLAGGDINRSQ